MASTYIINKYYASFTGLDARSNDLTRGSSFASEMRNVDYTKTGALVKRAGNQVKAQDVGGGGLFTWQDVDLASGNIQERLVTIDDKLHILNTGNIAVTYSGSALAYCDIYLNKDDANFYLDLYEDSNRVANIPLGRGIDESTPISISDAEAAINSITDFSCTVTGDGTVPAAFLEIQSAVTITTSTQLPFYYYTEVNSPSSTPFSDFWAKRGQSDFENVSFVALNNVLYISSYWSSLHKFDGQNVYRAGMPAGVTPTATSAGAGGVITNSDTKYFITYIQKDNKGNIVEGIESDESVGLNLTNENVTLTLTNIESSTGFNTNCGIVDGAQAGVTTITVDSGHTLKVGDTAYFFDGVSSSYVERLITGITATTITISGAAVTVADNAVISNNLRIGIWRNQNAGSTFSLVAEIPNNSFATTQTYLDNTTDANLGAEYIQPIKPHGLPPRGKYATAFRNQLIISGEVTNPNTVYYSDIDSPEFFPAASNSFEVDTEFGDVVTGITANNQNLFVFKQRSIHQISGDLAEDNFRVDRVNAGEIGCVAHHTIKEVEGVLFFLSTNGVYAIASNATAPQEVSITIEPRFSPSIANYNFKQAVAINWLDKDKYVLFLPETEVQGTATVSTASSKMLVYDYHHRAWLEWDALFALGGMSVFGNRLWHLGRRYSSFSASDQFYTNVIKDTGTVQDFADHFTAISFYNKTHWESLGEPSVFKKFIRLKVFSLDPIPDQLDASGFQLEVAGESNYIPNEIFGFTQDFTNGLDETGWGIAPWGLEPWGSTRSQEIVSKLTNTKSRCLRLTFRNTNLLETVYISGWELEIATPYKIMIKE